MKNGLQLTVNRLQKSIQRPSPLSTVYCQLSTSSGMTLIETLVAIVILTVAIVAPMSLTMQSLSASYYARDQVVAFNLAQEAIESVRAIRDGNMLRIVLNGESVSLLDGITIGAPFVIDTRKTNDLPDRGITECSGTCPYLQTDGNLYGYESGWSDTPYRRTVTIEDVGALGDEIRIRVDVSWDAGTSQLRTITLYENLNRWIDDGL